MAAYRCLLCNTVYTDLAEVLHHFESCHCDLAEVKTWRLYRVNGWRYGRWRRYRDLREAGLVKMEKRKNPIT